MRPRSRADIRPQGPSRAARPAAAVASRSARSAEATSAITSSVAGLTTSIVFPPVASRHSPLMKSCLRITAVVVMNLFSRKLGLALLDVRRQPFLRVGRFEQLLLEL